jgi:hypothetical protein
LSKTKSHSGQLLTTKYLFKYSEIAGTTVISGYFAFIGLSWLDINEESTTSLAQ